jgi:hypothetical protein
VFERLERVGAAGDAPERGERRRGGERLAAFQGREVVPVEVQTFFVDREDVPEDHRRGRRDQRAAGDAVRASPRKRRGGVFLLER